MSKIDCLFIHVPQIYSYNSKEYQTRINFIAMGFFSMANELKKYKFKTKIIHLGIEKRIDSNFDIAKYIKKHNIKMIGLSLHWHYQTYDVLSISQHIKSINPNCFIFLGGLTSSAFAYDILKKYPCVDAIIKGEGEKPTVELAKKLINNNINNKLNLSTIPNLYWKDTKNKIHKNKKKWFASELELNTYNFSNLKLLEHYDIYLRMRIFDKINKHDSYDSYLNEYKTIYCCLGRGCLGNCTWCGGGYNAVKIITGRDKISIRKPKIVAKEIIYLKKTYCIENFYICFDPYPSKQDYIIELFNILGKKHPNQIRISFECFGLPNKEFIDSFKKNLKPNSEIIISPEFSDEKLRNFHKTFNYTNKSLFKCLDYITSKNIDCILYLAKLPFNASTEDPENFINYVKSKYNNVSIKLSTIEDNEPFSPWSIEPQKYNLKAKLLTFEDYLKNSKIYRDFI